jgi:hypothetical protein
MARQFPGGATTDYILSSLTSNNDQRSYSLWTYRTGDGGNSLGRLWQKGTSGGALDTSHNNNPPDNAYDYNRRFSVSNGIWRYTRPSANAWHHIAILHDMSSDANDPSIYVDNVLQSLTEAQVPSGTRADNSVGYALGGRTDLGRNWEGYLAEFAVWNRILTTAEVAALSKGFSALFFPNGLVEYLPLIRDTRSYKLAAATVSGSVTVAPEHPRLILPSRF